MNVGRGMFTDEQGIWDEYRVTLFKKKIRQVLPNMPNIRFNRSKGRCHLIIHISSRYRKEHCEEIGAYVIANLNKHGIEAKEKRDSFGLARRFGYEPSLDYITIPIDQAALPERKRS
jgi:hypothetical protein